MKIHRVKVFLGFDGDLSMRLYTDKEFPWRRLDAVHLNTRWRQFSKFILLNSCGELEI